MEKVKNKLSGQINNVVSTKRHNLRGKSRVGGLHNNSIGLHLPVTTCRRFLMAEYGMPVVPRNRSTASVQPVALRLFHCFHT